ncbi:hypothetical protein HG535_0H04060 [Zygotorulaspora mrakii]|uniref:RRM domain-containing protein n=1 Tax=Zygotorulaspora mrakii TaxID=42260 RepID=A0A7H9BAM3_ZYGMR|nr:uncharacterized protein HG535_0H04060 [Zygotorulaspora mrakii]QLG75079.1 hypothetical protein HG535_0H04060 [Zygotorulaspora mrakii]
MSEISDHETSSQIVDSVNDAAAAAQDQKNQQDYNLVSETNVDVAGVSDGLEDDSENVLEAQTSQDDAHTSVHHNDQAQEGELGQASSDAPAEKNDTAQHSENHGEVSPSAGDQDHHEIETSAKHEDAVQQGEDNKQGEEQPSVQSGDELEEQNKDADQDTKAGKNDQHNQEGESDPAEGSRQEEMVQDDAGGNGGEASEEDDLEKLEKQAHESMDNSTSSVENLPASTEPSTNDENVNYDLLQKQAQYIMDSNMLNLTQFKENSAENKITALVNMLNSNSETAMPMTEFQSAEPETARTEQAPHVEEVQKPARPDLNSVMTPEERERYTKYLHGENKITELHDIPPKSRLFIGNLPLKNVSKEDLFRIFSPYGLILQINIKNAFGFIQYNNPKSVTTAIEKESQELSFGKKLILEISSSNARPQFDHGDHGTNSSSTFISSSKRPFQSDEKDAGEMYNDNNQGYKKSRRYVPSCVIYVKRTADRGYAYEVFNQFRRGTDLETDMIFLKPRMELRRMINEVAHDGVWGVILVNKTRNVDIQTFYKGPQGETKFDEYVSVSADDAIAIFNNLKPSRGVGGHAGMQNANPYASQQSPPMPAPQQGYYGGYGMAGHMQGPPPVQQPPYVQQGYGMPMQAQGYGAPQPMAQPYGRYQGTPAPLIDPNSAPQQLNSLLGAGGQMNQQQLLSAIQNLPPAVVSNLLSMAHGQQQQQQQSPHTQQQLLGLLQSMQGQQQPAALNSMAQSVPPMNDSFAPQHSSINSASLQQPPQQQQQSSAGSNVQSLLDSLAKLQK